MFIFGDNSDGPVVEFLSPMWSTWIDFLVLGLDLGLFQPSHNHWGHLWRETEIWQHMLTFFKSLKWDLNSLYSIMTFLDKTGKWMRKISSVRQLLDHSYKCRLGIQTSWISQKEWDLGWFTQSPETHGFIHKLGMLTVS